MVKIDAQELILRSGHEWYKGHRKSALINSIYRINIKASYSFLLSTFLEHKLQFLTLIVLFSYSSIFFFISENFIESFLLEYLYKNLLI